jgi:hypothetical protein
MTNDDEEAYSDGETLPPLEDDETVFNWGMMKTARNAVLMSAGYEKRRLLTTGAVIDRVRACFDIFPTCTTDDVVELVRCPEPEVVDALNLLVELREIYLGDLQYNLGLPASETLKIWARDEPKLTDVETDAVQ